MIPQTKADRDAALTWLQNLLTQMRIAARELRSPPGDNDKYTLAMDTVKSLAGTVDIHNTE